MNKINNFRNWLEKNYTNTISTEIVIFSQLIKDNNILNFYKKKFKKHKNEIKKFIEEYEEIKQIIKANKGLKTEIYYFFLHKYLVYKKFEKIYLLNKREVEDILTLFINIKSPKKTTNILYSIYR